MYMGVQAGQDACVGVAALYAHTRGVHKQTSWPGPAGGGTHQVSAPLAAHGRQTHMHIVGGCVGADRAGDNNS